MARNRNFQTISFAQARAKIKAQEQALSTPPEWLTRNDLCRRYSISRSKSYSLQEEGKLPEPSYHFGKQSPRWNAQELDRMMTSRKEQENG